ncbi:MAG: hypothetical protein JWO24_180 [Rhodospirillales bacterium]|jgi:hypothetical protein|nr:hypothetical protein [Rhodospirillales bacterium]
MTFDISLFSTLTSRARAPRNWLADDRQRPFGR